MWLHKRMGHPSRQTMHSAIMNGTWVGLPAGLKAEEVNKVLKSIHCTTCELCKRNKLPTRFGDGVHAAHPGASISVDYQGLINPRSVRGYTGFFLFKDSYSGLRIAHLTKDKSATTYKEALSKVISYFNSHGHAVLKIRCDAGSTENDAGVVEWLATEHKILVDPAAMGKQEQNPWNARCKP